jgi:chemotaxis family two-component system response regulator Rcp1
MVRVLLVEDSLADVELTRAALEEVSIDAELPVVRDGEEALAYLHREGEHADAVRPHLVLLDLNLPKMGGIEVLERLQADRDPVLRRLPVIVLTTSQSDADVARCYELRANCLVTKPMTADDLVGAVRSLASFWLGVATHPPQ